MPERIKLSRKSGWRLPANAVNVARPSKWGNPHRAANGNTVAAVARYRADLVAGRLRFSVEDARRELAGKDLACWCWRDWTCHADVLLELANAPHQPQNARRNEGD